MKRRCWVVKQTTSHTVNLASAPNSLGTSIKAGDHTSAGLSFSIGHVKTTTLSPPNRRAVRLMHTYCFSPSKVYYFFSNFQPRFIHVYSQKSLPDQIHVVQHIVLHSGWPEAGYESYRSPLMYLCSQHLVLWGILPLYMEVPLLSMMNRIIRWALLEQIGSLSSPASCFTQQSKQKLWLGVGWGGTQAWHSLNCSSLLLPTSNRYLEIDCLWRWRFHLPIMAKACDRPIPFQKGLHYILWKWV